MNVLLLTVLVSVGLAAGFVLFFLYLQRDRKSDPMRDCLLPFQEERPKGGKRASMAGGKK